MTDLDWQDDGACRKPGTDPEIFFPHSGEKAKIREAKAICADCPVWVECRADGLNGGAYRVGIWGGLTESDRKQLRRRAAASEPAATRHGGSRTPYTDTSRLRALAIAADYKARTGRSGYSHAAVVLGVHPATVAKWAQEAAEGAAAASTGTETQAA